MGLFETVKIQEDDALCRAQRAQKPVYVRNKRHVVTVHGEKQILQAG